MAEDEALRMVETMQAQLTALVRTIVTALRDRQVSAYEGMQIALQGTMLASSCMQSLQPMTPETRAAVLALVEQGHWTQER